MIWTAKQRQVLGVGVIVLCAALGWRYWSHREYVADPRPGDGRRAGELLNRIDPNTASWAALAIIPGVGEKRAKAIVAYREESLRIVPGAVVFRRVEDLQHVKDGDDETGVAGIGETTVEAMRAYLVFPGEEKQKQSP